MMMYQSMIAVYFIIKQEPIAEWAAILDYVIIKINIGASVCLFELGHSPASLMCCYLPMTDQLNLESALKHLTFLTLLRV